MDRDEQKALFGAWLNQYGAMLHHVANGFADSSDRDDLMQVLLLAMWSAAERYRGDARASTFLYRVAHNAALTWKKSERRRSSRIQYMDTELEPAIEPPGREGEALGHLYAAIRALPPVERSIMLLHLEGAGYAEIAEIHGITESNVGARLTRLRQNLSKQLETITHELR